MHHVKAWKTRQGNQIVSPWSEIAEDGGEKGKESVAAFNFVFLGFIVCCFHYALINCGMVKNRVGQE